MEFNFPIRYSEADIQDGYTMHPWLGDMERKTKEILRGVPKEQAVNIVQSISEAMSCSSIHPHIPSVVIFSAEGAEPATIWRKLLLTMRTPDYATPLYDPELESVTGSIKRILEPVSDSQHLSAIARGYLIRVVAGDPRAIEWSYQDMARRYPQSVNGWYEILNWQFKGKVLPDPNGLPDEKELCSLLKRNEEIAVLHNATHDRRLPKEGLRSYIDRQVSESKSIFPKSEDLLGDAARILDRVFRDYRKQAYALRRIPYEY